MLGTLSLVTAPTIEPVSLEDARDHCRVDAGQREDDAHLTRAVAGGREHVESLTGRQLILATWDWILDGWPCDRTELPLAPLLAVSSVSYLDADGDSQTLAADQYRVQTFAGPKCQPGRISRAYQAVWPSLYGVPGNVTIRFTAGYLASGSEDAKRAAVPAALRAAVLLATEELFRVRGTSVTGANVTPAAMAIENLVAPYRITRFR